MAQNRHWEQDKEATVYIGNIDERASTAMVYEIMLQMGPIHNIHMPRDRVTQNHQGFGFVEFRGPQDAEYAASVMNAIKLFGKPLRVNKASADKQKGTDVGAELFVGNLDHMVDEKLLYDTFSRFGPLLSLPKVARDDSGNSKGFGFVSFADFDSSDTAIANINGQYILSKEVSVQYAFKKDGRGERHGDEAERQLAAQAKMRNIVPEAPASTKPAPPGFDPSAVPVSMPPAGVPPHGMPNNFAPPSHRGPPVYNVPLPPAPTGLPARPPQSQGFPGGPPPPGFPPPPNFPRR
ncbi:RNA recognition motif domain-containing protein [Hirsutella rhossiliensis]|uniref:RNA recognition motif domain-containing protein n=1 Tax=Hirsutella rhossiliensis TaxID=111463 RepID=A0A9P8SKT2_9HYPO|nr:RNA recognition motif domain-containing protein [Hirsutella rhossiliensis]KAH0965105.1 RNA recognition motif domain-containing protein [Hirsutella rhossiliensis]